ncbi:MFS transporter [Agrococcus sp. SGAir0287]|uniref:MFS transporter n=1 Tax=Agrococcus sp. SGAir0287 TaxID=2070347 RepID=UPI0010CD0A59|nr:MFS transporter [Agrococcus sp. SGAir0287]QCR18862.1 MFS transporter [Agrococcus sp. SGAir0287]
MPQDRIPRSTVVRYSAGALGTGGFSTLPGLVLLYFMTDTLGIAALWAGLVIGIVRVWDVVADPVIGALSDDDDARTGSRRRWMLVGGIALPVLFVLMFAVPADLPPLVAVLWVGIAYFGAATAFSVFQVPYMALPASISHDYDERTRLLTARVIVLTIAILAFGGGGPALRGIVEDAHVGYLLMGVICAALLAVGCLVAVRSAPRHAPTAPPRRSIAAIYRETWDVLRHGPSLRALVVPFFLQALATGLMLAGGQYVATYILQDEDAITFLFVALIAPAILAAPGWQWLSARTSKRFAFQLASIVFIVGGVLLVPALLVPDALVYAPVALAGLGYAGMQSLPMAMLPDAMAHDRKRTGVDRSGVIGGVWTAMETTGFALGGLVMSIVLAATGYVASRGGAEQPESVVVGIAVAFSVIPALVVLVSLVPLRGYRLTRAVVDAEVAPRQETQA